MEIEQYMEDERNRRIAEGEITFSDLVQLTKERIDRLETIAKRSNSEVLQDKFSKSVWDGMVDMEFWLECKREGYPVE